MAKVRAALACIQGRTPRAARRRICEATLAAGLAVLASSGARAHEPPKGLALVWTDEASDALPVVLTNRGLVFPAQGAGDARFSLRCNEAYGVNTGARPRLWADPAGALVLATYAAVSTTPDRGCSWHKNTALPEGTLGRPIQHAQNPHALLVATVDVEPGSTVLASDDYGASWSVRGETGPNQAYTTLAWAPSDPQRVYASGMKIDLEQVQVLWLWAVSSDGGRSFEDATVANERKPLAVHPSDPDVVFAYELSDPLSDLYRVLRSEDAGKTFEEVLEVSDITSFAAAPDGSELWLGSGRNGGLYRSRDQGKSFVRVYEQIQEVQCLQQRAGKLWVCANMLPNVDGVWTTEDGGETFDEVFTFDEVTEPVRCDAPAAAQVCDAPWLDWERELLTFAAQDAGTPDAGSAQASASDGGVTRDGGAPPATEDASAPSPPRAPSASCALGHAERSLSWWPWLAAAWAVLALRRPRRA